MLFGFTSWMDASLNGKDPSTGFTCPMDNDEHTLKQLMSPDLSRPSSTAWNLVVTSHPRAVHARKSTAARTLALWF